MLSATLPLIFRSLSNRKFRYSSSFRRHFWWNACLNRSYFPLLYKIEWSNVCLPLSSYCVYEYMWIDCFIHIHSQWIWNCWKKNTCFCYAANYANRLNQQKRNIDKHKETEECVEMKGLWVKLGSSINNFM